VRNICYPSTLVRQVFGHGVDKWRLNSARTTDFLLSISAQTSLEVHRVPSPTDIRLGWSFYTGVKRPKIESDHCAQVHHASTCTARPSISPQLLVLRHGQGNQHILKFRKHRHFFAAKTFRHQSGRSALSLHLVPATTNLTRTCICTMHDFILCY
jgi:hypothetical protein